MKKNPKVLYIHRKHFRGKQKQPFFPFLKQIKFKKQDGFFETSLFSSCNVNSKPIEWVLENIDKINKKHDVVVLNSKFLQEKISLESIDWVEKVKIPVVLFCGYAQADILPIDNILDKFDLVYKRELIRDFSRYGISKKNCKKLRNTMLHCQLVPVKKTRTIRIPPFPEPRVTNERFEYDVFFAGSIKTNINRLPIIERLNQTPFNFYGGFTNKKSRVHTFKKLKKNEYISTIKRTKINLALEGYGQFTYRHLEIWCLGGFCLSTPSIRDITLPFGTPREGIHYVVFDDLDDIANKIKYYLKHEKERMAIAKAGRSFFEQIYDPLRHGREIRKEFEHLLKISSEKIK